MSINMIVSSSGFITARRDGVNINSILFKEFNKYLKYKNNEEYNGYNICLNSKAKVFEVEYKKNEYTISLVKEGNLVYWNLFPYNNSYYQTEVSNNIDSFKIVLFAIKDDIYLKEVNNEKK